MMIEPDSPLISEAVRLRGEFIAAGQNLLNCLAHNPDARLRVFGEKKLYGKVAEMVHEIEKLEEKETLLGLEQIK